MRCFESLPLFWIEFNGIVTWIVLPVFGSMVFCTTCWIVCPVSGSVTFTICPPMVFGIWLEIFVAAAEMKYKKLWTMFQKRKEKCTRYWSSNLSWFSCIWICDSLNNLLNWLSSLWICDCDYFAFWKKVWRVKKNCSSKSRNIDVCMYIGCCCLKDKDAEALDFYVQAWTHS